MPLAHPLFGPLFLAGLLAAAVWDMRRRRVPNALNFGFALLGAAYQGSLHGVEGVAFSLLGYVAVLASVFMPYVMKLYRGGDAKLVMAVGAWLGARDGITAFVYGVVAGGFVAAATALAHRQALALPAAERPDTAHAPMAVAFALGAVAAVCWPLWAPGGS